MTRGFTFDIKRFALHDGPGLRTTIFLKGCPLSCLGCHNPEGQSPGPELLFRPDRCTECGDCIPVCPQDALRLDDDGLHIAWDRCDLNGACVKACLPGALEIAGTARTVEELLDLLEADRIYFDESRGGVTFSGGEPFFQPEFLRELLEGCNERDLPVVLDTSGHAEPRIFRELAPMASHLLFDLKLMDSERHEAYTGVPNRWILENLQWAGNGFGGDGTEAPSLTVRIPLIPGINDDEANLRGTAAFLKGLDHVPPVDVLPYHQMGVGKYERSGKEYRLKDVVPPSDQDVRGAVGILEDAGLNVTVRGEHHGDD